MPYMTGTRILTLGGLGRAESFEPMLRATWIQNRRVTPQQPQNLLRAVTLGGVRGTARLIAGLGEVADAAIATAVGEPAPIIDLPAPSEPIAMNMPSLPAWPPWRKQSLKVQIGTIVAAASLSLVSAAVAGYHGYKRDRSVMAGVGWGFMGAIFPVVTPIVSFAQGYARPRGGRK